MESQPRNSSLNEAVSRLALVRVDAAPANDVLDLVTQLAVEVTPGGAGATLRFWEGVQVTGRRPHIVSSDARYAALEGAHSPSTDAISSGDAIHANGTLSRWPTFAEVARQLGVCDVAANPLSLGEDQHGCISVYSEEHKFDQQATLAVQVLARHASVTVANALAYDRVRRLNAQLSEGLQSRELIGLAKGILMRQERCSEADAFRILVRSSQRLDLKVREVARHVVALAEGRSDLPQAP